MVLRSTHRERRSDPPGRPPKSREETSIMRKYYVKVIRHMLSTAVLVGFFATEN
jgi:hypothetical protein